MLKYKLSQDAFQEYISCTKGNEYISFELAEKKLNRNILSSTKLYENDFVEKYQYGSLAIKVCFGEIISVYKLKGHYKFKGNKRYQLNKKLGISM